MAYNLRYFTSFYGTSDKRSTANPDLFQLNILELNGTASPEELEATEEPVSITYPNTGDNKLLPLRGSFLEASLIATSSFQLEELYTENERKWLIQLNRNGSRISNTFIIPDGCQEQFMFTPYVVQINAVDGLGLLKNLAFVQNDGNFWIGKMTWIEVIYACLNRVGVPDMDIYTCVNIYPSGVTQGNTIDPFGITYINAERFLKDDGVNPMNCDEVLSAILQEWTACIIQSEGHWWIYRPTEAALSGTLVFRHYVNGIYTGILSKNIDVLLGGYTEGNILAPLYHEFADQLKMIEKPFKTVAMSYKYGEPANILENPSFIGINTSGPGDPIGPRDDVNIPGWTKSGTVEAGISGGTALKLYAENPTVLTDYYENNFPIDMPVGYQFKLLLQYESTPALSATDMTFQLEVDNGSEIYYLQSNGSFLRLTDPGSSPTFIIRSNQGVSNSEFISDILPFAGDAIFRVFQPATPASDIIYSSIEGIVLLANNPVVGEIHTTQQDADYSFANDTINVFNGDGPTQGFLGAIFKSDEVTLTTEWVRRGLSESPLAQPSEADKAFLRIAVEEIQRLYGSPFVKFEGTIGNYFNPLSRFTINLITGKFMPVSLVYNLQANTCKAVLTRISNTEISLDYTVEPDYGETQKVLVK